MVMMFVSIPITILYFIVFNVLLFMHKEFKLSIQEKLLISIHESANLLVIVNVVTLATRLIPYENISKIILFLAIAPLFYYLNRVLLRIGLKNNSQNTVTEIGAIEIRTLAVFAMLIICLLIFETRPGFVQTVTLPEIPAYSCPGTDIREYLEKIAAGIMVSLVSLIALRNLK